MSKRDAIPEAKGVYCFKSSFFLLLVLIATSYFPVLDENLTRSRCYISISQTAVKYVLILWHFVVVVK